MEILISIFVLAIGLLGLAALLPVGRMTIVETIKADRSGDCGRAGIRDVRVRHLLDPYPWAAQTPGEPPAAHWLVPGTDTDATPLVAASTTGGSFIIDPLGAVNGAGSKFGAQGASIPNPPIQRITLGVAPWVRTSNRALTKPEAEQIFYWKDDLLYSLPEELNPPQPPGRPLITSLDPASNFTPRYSWFASVTPAAAELKVHPANRNRYLVSVVVCYSRDFSEATAAVPAANFLDLGIGGGSILLSETLPVKENHWIALVGGGLCYWYKVLAVGDATSVPGTQAALALSGPDWPRGLAATAVSLGDSVIGVYTTTLEVDRDLMWKK